MNKSRKSKYVQAIVIFAMVFPQLPALAFDSRALEGLYTLGIIFLALILAGAHLLLSLVLFLLRKRVGKTGGSRAALRGYGWFNRVAAWLAPISLLIFSFNSFLEHPGAPPQIQREAAIFSLVGLALLTGLALLVGRLAKRLIEHNPQIERL